MNEYFRIYQCIKDYVVCFKMRFYHRCWRN